MFTDKLSSLKMKAIKEVRKWINRMREKYGRKNGNFSSFIWDNPYLERKQATNKRLKDKSHGKTDNQRLGLPD